MLIGYSFAPLKRMFLLDIVDEIHWYMFFVLMKLHGIFILHLIYF